MTDDMALGLVLARRHSREAGTQTGPLTSEGSCCSSALAGNDVVKLACPMKLNTGQIQAQPQAVPIFSLTITCLRLGCQQQKWPLMPPRLAGQERSEPCCECSRC